VFDALLGVSSTTLGESCRLAGRLFGAVVDTSIWRKGEDTDESEL
jgi:hypothetical protein